MTFKTRIAIILFGLALMGAQYTRMNPVRVGDLADGTAGELYSWSAAGVSATVATGTSAQVLTSNGAGAAPTFQTSLTSTVIVVADEKAAGTEGGTFTQDAWQTRVLNTLKVNDGTTASLSSNQVTLPAGDYECWASAPAFAVEEHMIRLQNITGTATIATGTSENAAAAVNASTSSTLYTKFTLGVSSALEIQHRCVATKTDRGFGEDTNFGTVETYAIVMFRKVN